MTEAATAVNETNDTAASVVAAASTGTFLSGHDAALWLSSDGIKLRSLLCSLQREETVARVDIEVDEDHARRDAIEIACGLHDNPDADWDDIQAAKLRIYTMSSGYSTCPPVDEAERQRHVFHNARDKLLEAKYDRLVTRQFLREARWLDFTLRRIEMLVRAEAGVRERIEQLAAHEVAPFALVRLQLDVLVAQGTEGTPVHVEEVEREVRFRVITFDEISAREVLQMEKDADLASSQRREQGRHENERAARESFVSSEWFERYLVDRDYEVELTPMLETEMRERQRLLILHLWRVVLDESSGRDLILQSEEFIRTGRDAGAAVEYDDALIAWEARGSPWPQPKPTRALVVAEPDSLAYAIDEFWNRFSKTFADERKRREQVLAYQQLAIGPGGIPILAPSEKHSVKPKKKNKKKSIKEQVTAESSNEEEHTAGPTARAPDRDEEKRLHDEADGEDIGDAALHNSNERQLDPSSRRMEDDEEEVEEVDDDDESDEEGLVETMLESNANGFLEWRDEASGHVEIFGHVIARPVTMPTPYQPSSSQRLSTSAEGSCEVVDGTPSSPAGSATTSVTLPEEHKAAAASRKDDTEAEVVAVHVVPSLLPATGTSPHSSSSSLSDDDDEGVPTIESIDERRRLLAMRWL